MEPSNKTPAPQTEAEQRCDIVSATTTIPEPHSQTAVQSCSMAPETSDEPNGDSDEGESDEEVEEDEFDKEFSKFDSIEEFEPEENDEDDIDYSVFLIFKFRDEAQRVISKFLAKSPDDPILDSLPEVLKSLVFYQSSTGIFAMSKDAQENLEILLLACPETRERVGAALAELWRSKDVVQAIGMDGLDAEDVCASSFKTIERLATAYKLRLRQRLEANEATAVCNEKWGPGWKEKLGLLGLEESLNSLFGHGLDEGAANDRRFCSCGDLATASPNWDQAKRLLNHSMYSRLVRLWNGETQGSITTCNWQETSP
ncbi:hypothetical protein HDK77DRAFT_498336 [Phyllosticta capitalensis]